MSGGFYLNDGTLYLDNAHGGTPVAGGVIYSEGGGDAFIGSDPSSLPVKQIVLEPGQSISIDPVWPYTSRPYGNNYNPTIYFVDGTSFLGGLIVGDAPGGSFYVVEPAGQYTETVTFTQCLAAGTRIDTPDGPRPIETLRLDDAVLCHAGGSPVARPVTAIRRWTLDDEAPVRIAAGAFAAGAPSRDLVLSPDHAVFIDGMLVPARHLVDGHAVTRDALGRVTYHHLSVAGHDLIRAEGVLVETLLPLGPAALEGAALLWEAAGCAPLVVTGDALDRIREGLRRRRVTPAPA
ncbi:Hint domain-containing protein [Acidisphaera rubrifaciens]|uniref:Hedgehog/Intein (Hint) domain-containing protein n=1 Tax=Acidisphaera rubrifaciens HS-AP3 TaxID=1231350 RepID=A0A0D6P6Y4_9PROT|nr:Hint domain-containing protein [Acidisphaera rubrifaciens]GAN76609.1 hypothetical protein Asru_0130_02 [Acidisphaera rubrifaciens HS-AP3]